MWWENSTGTGHTYHQDEQGSTAYVTGTTGEIENLYSYEGFGNILEKKETITNRILYTGQQYGQETKQYYLRARYYNAVIGRFTQEDTYRGDGLNLYAYCRNNPVIYYDPSGHENIPCDGIDEESKQIRDSRGSEIENSSLPQIDNETEVILPSKPYKNKTEGHWEIYIRRS